MLPLTEEERLRLAALAYVIDLHDELTQENGAPRSALRTKPSISFWAIRNCAGRWPLGRRARR